MRIRTSSRRLAALVAVALGLVLGTAAPALALTLDEARTGGMVIEGNDGFLEARQNTAEVRTLIQRVNEERRAHYADVAQRTGQPIDAVAVTAAESLIGRLPPGTYYESSSGQVLQR